MGSSTSKLKKKLAKGDECAALVLFDTNKDLQKKFDPNSTYGERYNHDTPLHMASRYALRRALRLFLFDFGGNPNKKNGRNESSLHCVCQLSNDSSAKNISAHEECVNMLIQWKGSQLGKDEYERLDIAAQDKVGNTALHYAAQSGFLTCVKLLVDLGAPLFTENDAGQTPCEIAEAATMATVAQYLESKMVFYENEDSEQSEVIANPAADTAHDTDDYYQGLRPQELQEAKDTLIVETSDMLRVPLFTAEVLLRHHEWSREVLLEAWILDPVSCCEKSGVVPPANLDDITNTDHELNILKTSASQNAPFEPTTCEICFDDIVNSAETIPMVCEHQFCQSCWQDYLNIKIKEGETQNIVCPAFDCKILVPVEFIETTVSSTMARRYLQFDIKAFVACNPRLVWCPYPGCGLAIQNPDRDRSASVTSRSSLHSKVPYQSVTATCSSGHAFCWLCQSEPHEPASCDDYKSWIEKIAQLKEDEFSDVTKKSEAAANIFWMLNNSKKCPHCKSPIEKNDGCNHMRCGKCKHDFCWVCLEPWKWHNSMTGGFFRCTRYEVVDKVEGQQQNEISDAADKHKALQELNRFAHYYTRYENHKHSLELEIPLLEKAKQKMTQLASSYTGESAGGSSDSGSKVSAARFIEEAVSTLIKARHLLQFCYIYGYYLQDTGIKRMVFELLQTELEAKTEYLSEIVARPYLRTPKAEIIKITKLVSDKTGEYLTSIANGLLPQDLPQVEEARLKSRSVKASKLAAASGASSGAAWLTDSDDSSDGQLDKREVCKAANCNKLKLRHSGALEQSHDYCSLSCLKSDYLSRSKRKAKRQGRNQQIDLLQALEMSRLQLLQDMDSLNTGSSSDVSMDDETTSLQRRMGINTTELPADPILEHVLRLSQSVYAEEEDEDLTLAIQMSMQPAEIQREMMRERSDNRRHRAQSHSESVTGSLTGGSSVTGASNITDTLSTQQQQQPETVERDEAQELYRARLVELDNAIADLLGTDTSPSSVSLRRAESERRRDSLTIDEGSSPSGGDVCNAHPVRLRRTRSERKGGRRTNPQ